MNWHDVRSLFSLTDYYQSSQTIFTSEIQQPLFSHFLFHTSFIIATYNTTPANCTTDTYCTGHIHIETQCRTPRVLYQNLAVLYNQNPINRVTVNIQNKQMQNFHKIANK